MASYTNQDLIDASTYTNERIKLMLIEKMYEKYPFITSHCTYSVTRATRDDYYFTKDFESKNRNILVSITVTEDMCNLLSCNPTLDERTCNERDEVNQYYIGENGNALVCQPACYFLKDTISYNDGVAKTQMFDLKYNKGKCAIAPTIKYYMEMPFYRDNTRYKPRVNDLPIGFDLGYNKYSTSGLTYNYNKSYCSAYYDEFDPDTKQCYTNWWTQVLNVVIGEQFIKYTRAIVDTLVSGDLKSSYPKPNLPDLPDIPSIYKVNNWKKNINKDFVVPDPGMSAPETKSTPIRDKMGEIKKNCRIKFKTFNDDERNRLSEILENTTRNKRADGIIGGVENFWEMIKGFFTDEDFILSMITDIELYESILSDVIIDSIRNMIKKLGKDVLQKMIPKMLMGFIKIIKSGGTKIFSIAIKSVISKTLYSLAVRAVSGIAIALGRIATLASSVIGIILIVTTVLDLIFTFWDPLGFNSKYPPNYIDDLMLQADIAVNSSLGTSSPELTFETLAYTILTEAEILEINIKSYEYMFEYLDSLVVNSEGSRIDKGELIVIENDINDNMQQPHIDESLAKLHLYTQKDLNVYEDKHLSRIKTSTILRNIGNGLLIVGFGLLIIQLYILSMLIFIIMIVVYGLSFVTMYSNLIFDNIPISLLEKINKSIDVQIPNFIKRYY